MIVPPKVATWIKLNSRALGDRRVEGTREGSIVIIIHKEKEPKEADLGDANALNVLVQLL